MTARTAHIDETLLQPRKLVRSRPDDDGLGYLADLSCGHQIWITIMPPEELYCGACLNTLVTQVRELQAEQKPSD
jgi:hypothetical protein